MIGKALRLLGLVGFATGVLAAPPNTAVLDGRPLEYDNEDLRASYTGGGGIFGPGTYIENLYVTWDDTYLYVMLQGAEVNDKLVVMLDVDPEGATGATTTTNWTGIAPSFIEYNDVGWEKSGELGALDFGLDYQIASEGFYNNVVRILYDGVATPDTTTVESLFDSGNGNTPNGSPVDMVVQSDGTTCGLKGLEARIPWNVLYPSNGPIANRFGIVSPDETVPAGAKIRLFATIHNNSHLTAFNANDVIPEQVSPNAFYTNGLLTTDTYLDIIVDGDNDGFPDLGAGDVNAPYIRYASGVQGLRTVFVQMSEDVNASTATNPNNWRVDTYVPGTVTVADAATLLLELTNDLPAAGTVLLVTATNVEDAASNQRFTQYCLNPAANGLTNALTVRFVLETASGLGQSPGASNFFVNGGSFPLEFGYPPATVAPLAQLSGSLYYRDVVFPPGTAQELFYKYSGQLNATGTNTYEAVRMVDFASAARKLTLPLDETSIVITDYLGAAAAPFRVQGNPTNRFELYTDGRRGDAGVRREVQITFQLDLSGRNRAGLTRVMVEGSDPLRGFNNNEQLPVGVSDYPGGGSVGWNSGGIALNDDGIDGDETAGDGIYSRTWLWSTDGTDPYVTFVPDYPYSLVAGTLSDPPPYYGDFIDRRSPRSFAYKFAVARGDGSGLESPAANIEYYIEDTAGTNIVLAPFVWANEDLPLPPPTNSPTMHLPVALSGNVVRVLFENLPGELQHGVLISTNLAQGWLDFGTRAAGSSGNWTALVGNADARNEHYAAFAGPAQPFEGVRIEPFPLDPTGGLLRIYYVQHSRGLAGDRNVQIAGTFNGWSPAPMTFLGDGVWRAEVVINEAASSNIMFKPRNLTGTIWEQMSSEIPDNNYIVYKGFGRASWTPLAPTNEGVLTITYDNATGPLTNSPTVSAWLGYEEQWFDSSAIPMTNIGGTLWETAVMIPTNRSLSVNFVFRNAAGSIWDKESTPGGRLNRAFITPNPYP